MKRLAFVGLLLCLTTTATAQESTIPYTDVPDDAWYRGTLEKLLLKGWISGASETFRPVDPANRAEFTKLIVDSSGGFLLDKPENSSFTDVPLDAWFRDYFEEAAQEGWVRGEGNCYGQEICYARPEDSITRAEAAALIVRAFGFEMTGTGHTLPDVSDNAWYYESIAAAVDNCVLAGDDDTGNMRPADLVNRAEMATMVLRADQSADNCASDSDQTGE